MEKSKRITVLFTSLIFIYISAIFTIPVLFDGITPVSIPVYIISAFLFCFVVKKEISKFNSYSPVNKTDPVVLFALTLIVTFFYFFISMKKDPYIVFPSPDSERQYSQALTGVYSDWHPVIHTLLFFKLPSLFSDSYNFIILWQMFFLSLSNSYLVYTLRKNGFSILLCLTQFLIMLNPSLLTTCANVWKDCGMTVFLIVLAAQYVNIVCSDGEWLNKKINVASLAVILSLSTLMRHNAILFTAPLFIAICFYSKKYPKKIAAVLLSTLIIIGFIKVPLFRILNVEKPGNRKVETVGICMVMMGNVVTNSPELLDDETRDFLYGIAPQYTWENLYSTGDYNGVKFSDSADNSLIEEAGYGKILKYTAKAFSASPKLCLEAFFKVTGMVWNPYYEYDYYLDFNGNESVISFLRYNINYLFPDFLSPKAKAVLSYLSLDFPSIDMGIGVMNLLVLATAFLMIENKKQIKLLLTVLPMFCYNFGTALLLTCFDLRFFFYTLFLTVPLICVLLREHDNLSRNLC